MPGAGCVVGVGIGAGRGGRSPDALRSAVRLHDIYGGHARHAASRGFMCQVVLGLAHWPQLQGQIIGADDVTGRDPMWALILNVVVWSAIFGLIAVWAVRRGRRRQ